MCSVFDVEKIADAETMSNFNKQQRDYFSVTSTYDKINWIFLTLFVFFNQTLITTKIKKRSINFLKTKN